MERDIPPSAPQPKSGFRQAGAFGLVGIINTLLDILVLNLGIFVLRLPVVPANVLSVSVALVFSYTANSRWVFGGSRQLNPKAAFRFVVVTLVGLYGLQTLIVYLLTQQWLAPARIVQGFGLGQYFSTVFIVANTAKLLATLITAVWNFVLYKRYVFTSDEATPIASSSDEA